LTRFSCRRGDVRQTSVPNHDPATSTNVVRSETRSEDGIGPNPGCGAGTKRHSDHYT
jgi:hypothetical protein